MANPFDQFDPPASAKNPFDVFDDPNYKTPEQQDSAWSRGVNQAKSSAAITANLATGDTTAAAKNIAAQEAYRRANPGTKEGQELAAAWDRGEGITGGITEVGREFAKDWNESPGLIGGLAATGRNLAAMGSGIVQQLPNSIAPLAGFAAGAAGGAAAGSAVPVVGNVAGGITGGFLGASAGNALMEGGEQTLRALQKAGVDPNDHAAVKAYLDQNSGDILAKTGIKGGIIGAIDTATMRLGHGLLTKPAEAAAERAMKAMGIDVADKAAVQAATKTPEFAARIASDATLKAQTTGVGGLARNATVAGLEPAGEFAGEYLGQGAATGEFDSKDAFLEALSSLGQSGVTFAGQKAYAAIKNPLGGAKPDATPSGSAQPEQAQAAQAAGAGPQSPTAPAPTAPSVDPVARMAELEKISKGTQDMTVPGPDGNPMVIRGTPGRFFTPDEHAEYQRLKADAGPLARAAVTAEVNGASPQATVLPAPEPVAQQPTPADPMAERLAAVQGRMQPDELGKVAQGLGLDNEFVQQMHNAAQIAGNWANARPEMRERALSALEDVFSRYDTRWGRPNAPEQSTAVVPAVPQPYIDPNTLRGEARDVTPAGELPNPINPNQLAAPVVRGLESPQARRARVDADAAYEQAFQDLVKAEQLGASDRELMGYQQALREAAAHRETLAQQLADTDTAVAGRQQAQTAQARRAVLDSVLNDPETQNHLGRFQAELKRQGFSRVMATGEERQAIERFQNASAAFGQPDTVPSAPNEMDAAAMGIRERKAKAPQPAPRGEARDVTPAGELPAPSVAPRQLTAKTGDVLQVDTQGRASPQLQSGPPGMKSLSVGDRVLHDGQERTVARVEPHASSPNRLVVSFSDNPNKYVFADDVRPVGNPQTAERTDGTTATVPDTGMTIVHGSGNTALSLDGIQIVRQNGQKQGKKGRTYGGFYGTSEADAAQADGYASMMGGTPTLYSVRIRPGTRVLNKVGDITRLSERYINELVAQGYGVVVGKDPRGRTEYAVIDRAAIESLAPRNAAAQQSADASTPSAAQAVPSAPAGFRSIPIRNFDTAQRKAQEMSQSKGEPYAVAQHPKVAGAFAVVPQRIIQQEQSNGPIPGQAATQVATQGGQARPDELRGGAADVAARPGGQPGDGAHAGMPAPGVRADVAVRGAGAGGGVAPDIPPGLTTKAGGFVKSSHGNEGQAAQGGAQGLKLRNLRTAAVKAAEDFRSYDKRAEQGKADGDTYFAKIAKANEAENALGQELQSLPEDGFSLEASTRDGRKLYLNASARDAGKWQVTRLDKAGQPWGDTVYETRAAAIKEFLSDSDLSTVRDYGGLMDGPATVAKSIPRGTAKSLLEVVRRNGGVAKRLQNDIIGESVAGRGGLAPGVFRGNGLGEDRLAELLHQHGFMSDADLNNPDDTSGAGKALELIGRAVKGERILSIADEEAQRAKGEEDAYRTNIRQEAGAAGIKTAFRKFSDVEDEVLRMREAAMDRKVAALDAEERQAYDDLLADAQEIVDSEEIEATIEQHQNSPLRELIAVLQDVYNRRLKEINAEISSAVEPRSFNEEEFRNDAAEEGNGNRQAVRGEAGKGSKPGGGNAGAAKAQADEFSLQSQTEAELRANQEALAAQQQREAEAQRQADEKAQADRERGSYTLTGSDRAADANPGQGGLFDQSPPKVEQRTKRDAYTRDIFDHPLPAEPEVRAAPSEQQRATENRDILAAGAVPGAQFATVAGPRKTGEVRSGVTHVRSAVDAAHVLADMRKLPQEAFAVLVLDEGDKPIAVLHLFKGATSQASVYPEVVTKSVYETPGAAGIWYAHNHPSGKAEPSTADEMLTKALSQAFGAGTGITVRGHVIIAGTRAVEMGADGTKIGGSFPIRGALRQNTIPVTERIFRKVGTLGPGIDGPSIAEREIPRIADGKTGVVFANQQHAPVAFLPMTIEQMQKLRDGRSARELFGAAARSNASAAFINFANGESLASAKDAATNLYNALHKNRDIRVLDFFVEGKSKGSALDDGGRSGTFFRRDTAPQPIDRSALNPVADRIRQAYPSQTISVHESDQAPTVPKSLRDEIAAKGAQGDVAGAYHKGVVHLFRSAMTDEAHAEKVAMHELTHAGLARLFGLGINKPLAEIYASNANVREAADRLAKQYGYGQRIATEEALADLGGEMVGVKGWDKLVAYIRAALRRLGMVSEWSDRDVAALVQRARDANRSKGATTLTGAAMFQKVWHGSPHDFDEFKTEKMGSGEGAQAYGWGHYFAGRKEVAEWYRNRLGAGDTYLRGKLAHREGTSNLLLKYDYPDAVKTDADALAVDAMTRFGNRQDAASFIEGRTSAFGGPSPQTKREAIALLENGEVEYRPKGRLYEASIPEDSEFLLWDKPLSEQPEKVRSAIEKLDWIDSSVFSQYTGQQLYEGQVRDKTMFDGANKGGAQEQVSRELNASGVSGIKYLDGTSRSSGDGSYNYVVFDDSNVKVESKFSFAGQNALTADRFALENAQQRLAMGEDAETVRQETGWHVGADGRYRFEISDHDANLYGSGNFGDTLMGGDTLGDVLDHPRLFAAYPQLRDVKVATLPADSKSLGSFNVASNTIRIREDLSSDQALSAILHELQHAIQRREQFSTGTNLLDAGSRDAYFRTAGEVEARNTQARQDMTDAERRFFSPQFTASVKDRDVIVNWNGKEMASERNVTDTPQFKAWFGDSVVTDNGKPMSEGGKPLVVYHGTNKDFDEFSQGEYSSKTGNANAQIGFFFTPNPQEAGRYATAWSKQGGNVMPVYLAINNPYEMTFKEADDMAMAAFRLMQSDGSFDPNASVKFGDMEGQKRAAERMQKYEKDARNEAAARRRELIQQGYDGVVIRMKAGDEYIAFRPEQIKSATGNAGAFSSDSGDIRFSRAGQFAGSVLSKFSPGAEEIVGASARQYTPEQQAMFGRTGRTIKRPSIKERIAALWQDAGKKLAQGLVDQFAPIKDITSKGYMLARLSKGSAGAFEALLNHGKLSLRDGVYDADQSGGMVDRLLRPLQGEGDDVLWWVAANRAERLATEGRENLFTPEDISAGKSLAQGTTAFDYTLQHDVHGAKKGTVTRDRTLIYRDAAKTLDEFQRNVLDVAEQSELIDGDSRKIWEHEFYVPFYRVSDDGDGVRGVNVKSALVRQQAFKQLKGGSDKLNSDLLANTLKNMAHLLDASAKNRAARATLEAAEQMGAARPAQYGEKKTVWYAGYVERTIPKGQEYVEGGMKKVSDGTATIRQHGKVEYVVDDPYLMTAISSLEYAGLRGPAMDAMSTFKHVLTVGVTASPFFKVRNLIRDSIAAIGTAPLSGNIAANLREGYQATNRDSQDYVSMLASGGLIRFGTMLEGKESDRVRQLVKQGVKRSTILDSESKVRQIYDRYIEPAISAYNELGNRGEEINRAALYKQMRAKGADHATASFMARDLMDFSMQGAWTGIRFLTQVVPFMNARLQGLYKLGRAAKDDPRRFAAVLGATAMFSIALMAAYSDDDDWKKREDWDRDNYFWFKLGGTAFRIPRPFEIGAIASLAERGVEYFASDEMTGQRFIDRLGALLSDNLSMNPIPQLVKPILDVYANKDSFSGRPIETMGMERLRPDYRFTENTSMVARAASTAGQAVAGAVGKDFLSPVQIDQMIRGYFGWLGTFVLGASDWATRPLAGEPERPAPDWFKTATGGMVADLEGAPSRYVSHIYDQAKILEEAYGTHRQLLKEGKVEEAKAFAEDYRDQLAQYRRVEFLKRAESGYNAQIRKIERSEMPADQKREEINRIRASQDQAARAL